jgi:hypothetical protein
MNHGSSFSIITVQLAGRPSNWGSISFTIKRFGPHRNMQTDWKLSSFCSVSTGCTQPPLQWVQDVHSLLFSEYTMYTASNSVRTGYSQPLIQWAKDVPSLLFSKYRLYPVSYSVSTGCTQPPIQWVQHVPSLLFSTYKIYTASYSVSTGCTQPLIQ